MTMFASVDVNNFYISCGTVFRPDLKGKPTVIVSNNDGCIISRSVEAKSLGIKNGESFFEIKSNPYYSSVHFFNSNYVLYADLSDRVIQTPTAMSPSMETYSIDEALINLSGVMNCVPLSTFGHEIRTHISKNTGLTAGVGIAQTKTLVKLASHAAKTWRGTGGAADLSNIACQCRLLALVPVEEVQGVGQKMSKKPNLMGINTALNLTENSLWVIKKYLNVVLERTVRELRDEPCLEPQEFSPTKQQTICSRSFGNRVTQYSDTHQAICACVKRIAEKLRSEHQFCRLVSVFVWTSPYAINETCYGNQASMRLLTPFNDARGIMNYATNYLRRIRIDGYRYTKAGVVLADFLSNGIVQLNLFDDNAPRKNSVALTGAVDQLN